MKMKMMGFLLLLLICSLSTAQLHKNSDNEVFPFGKQTETQRSDPKLAVDHQQTCAPDLHAVLREMSASLAEQRVEMRHLQAESEAQAAKLRELELQKTDLDKQKAELDKQKAELDKQKTDLDKQKTELDKQKTELGEQKTDLNNIKQQFQAQAAELVSINARSNVTENQVEALRRDAEVRQVAFSAGLLTSGYGHIGPFNTQTPLVFRHVLSNIGNAYSPNTGFFIAPVRGAYHFEIYITAYNQPSHAAGAVLVKNGVNVFLAFQTQSSNARIASNGATLLLEAGDVVYLAIQANTMIYDSGYHRSNFSGHLLFTM